MKAVLKRVVAVSAPIVTAKAVKEGKRAWRLFRARYDEIKREKAR
jgi:hypothetical protein